VSAIVDGFAWGNDSGQHFSFKTDTNRFSDRPDSRGLLGGRVILLINELMNYWSRPCAAEVRLSALRLTGR
jgi:hypothetical protein